MSKSNSIDFRKELDKEIDLYGEENVDKCSFIDDYMNECDNPTAHPSCLCKKHRKNWQLREDAKEFVNEHFYVSLGKEVISYL